MRRLLLLGLPLALLALTACGAEGKPEPPEPEGYICVLTEPAPPGQEGLYIRVEREVYDPSLTTFTYFIYNHSEETVEFGEDYRVQRLADDGSWTDLTPREDWAFTSIGYILPPGDEMALTCTLERYEEKPEPGSYRLWKPLGGSGEYPALFVLGDSPYTAETPYGFGPLEDLPEDCRVPTASEDYVVFLKDGVGNPEPAEEFLFKAGLGASCQLRAVEYRSEGMPVITDVICEDGRFLQRQRKDGAVTERWFSYLVTDGQGVFLSNGADWADGEKYGDTRALLLPPGIPAELVEAVEDMTARRLEGNITRYLVRSRDGTWSAGLTDTPTEFSVSWQSPGEGSRGAVYDLQNWDGLETAITGAAWEEDGTLLLACETADGGTSTLRFDPETEHLTTVELCGLPLAEEGQ